MTDETNDQPDVRTVNADASTTGKDVPQDTGWEVIAQAPYDPANLGGLTPTIISAVADAEDVPPKTIKNPPLYEVIDAAALEGAMFGSDTGTRTDDCSTEFMYRDFRIVVQTDGWVLVHEPADT